MGCTRHLGTRGCTISETERDHGSVNCYFRDPTRRITEITIYGAMVSLMVQPITSHIKRTEWQP